MDGASALFIDQTAQLGGAELCLLDTIRIRKHPRDRVILFQDGPLRQQLADDGTKVMVSELSSRGASLKKQSGIASEVWAIRDIWRVAKVIAREAIHCDTIYANTAKAMVVGSIAAWLTHKPIVYHLHDILSSQHFSASNRKLLGLLAARATRIIANSNATADALKVEAPHIDPSKIKVVYNGIHPEPFDRAVHSDSQIKTEVKKSLGLADQPVVGVFGRISPWKGQKLALEAMEQLPGVHLIFVGAALFGESDYERELKRLTQADALVNRIHWLGFRSDVADLMTACDVILHCSTAPEPFGRVIVEAMLARRPVVASSAGGACEIIDSHRTGFLFTPGSTDELVLVLKRALVGGMDVEQMIQNAAEEARKRFDPSERTMDVSRVIDDAATLKAN